MDGYPAARANDAAAAAIGTWFRHIRRARGLSQEQLANEADVAVTTYCRLERAPHGRHHANPTLDTLTRVLAALRVTSAEAVEFATSLDAGAALSSRHGSDTSAPTAAPAKRVSRAAGSGR